jgi:hypothetical protein
MRARRPPVEDAPEAADARQSRAHASSSRTHASAVRGVAEDEQVEVVDVAGALERAVDRMESREHSLYGLLEHRHHERRARGRIERAGLRVHELRQREAIAPRGEQP